VEATADKQSLRSANRECVMESSAVESVSTALNQTRRFDFFILSMIWSENRFPLFGIMLYSRADACASM
jgi:hypothetical protein